MPFMFETSSPGNFGMKFLLQSVMYLRMQPVVSPSAHADKLVHKNEDQLQFRR